jgi:hypothetical protein
MPVHNADVAAAFEEIADLLELGGELQRRLKRRREAG